MSRLYLIDVAAWILGPCLLVAGIIWLIRMIYGDNNQPPPSGGSQMDMTDGFFLNEWSDGD